jgi:transposase
MGRTEVLQGLREMKFDEIHDRFRRGRLSAAEAADWLGVSERTFRRWRGRYAADGPVGLLDRRLGKVSPARIAADEVDRIVSLYRDRYAGWNVRHFHERAVAQHGLAASYGWTKSVLHASGAVRPAPRRGAHRKKRPRKPLPGLMLHQDGSRHLWLPALGRQIDLIVTMDDATSELYSMFLVEEEGTWSSFQGIREVVTRHGLFCSFYTDRGSHYFYTPKAGEKVSKTVLTEVGRALKELDIRHIGAYSPEARGRSERMFGTLQDRLVKELADAGIDTVEAANRFIRETYLPEHNRAFMVEASEPGTALIPWPGGDLDEVLCQKAERVVDHDNTVSFDRLKLQLEPSPLRAHFVRATVEVRRYADRSISIFYGPRCIGRYGPDGTALTTNQTRAA